MQGVHAMVTTMTVILLAVNILAQDSAEKSILNKAMDLNQVTGAEAIRDRYRKMVSNRPEGKAVIDAADQAFKKAGSDNKPFNSNALLILGRAAFHLRKLDAGERFLKAYVADARELQSPSKILMGYNALIFNLYEAGRFTECEKICQELLDFNLPESADEEGVINKAKSNVLRRLLTCQARNGKLAQAEEAVKRLERRGALRPIGAADLRCRLLREAGKLDETLKAYQTLIDLVDNDEEIKDKEQKVEIIDDLKYSMTGVLMEMKKVDQATEILQALLKKEPDNATFNNDLGYIWADNFKNLDKCEAMVRKAIEEDRKLRLKTKEKTGADEPDDNASYLDSLGWVLFRNKKFSEAVKPLLDASRMDGGQNIEIYDHLGDVLVALGRKAEAIKAYETGIELASATRRDQAKKIDVEKKLKELK